jgi:hypothetical protein
MFVEQHGVSMVAMEEEMGDSIVLWLAFLLHAW